MCNSACIVTYGSAEQTLCYCTCLSLSVFLLGSGCCGFRVSPESAAPRQNNWHSSQRVECRRQCTFSSLITKPCMSRRSTIATLTPIQVTMEGSKSYHSEGYGNTDFDDDHCHCGGFVDAGGGSVAAGIAGVIPPSSTRPSMQVHAM